MYAEATFLPLWRMSGLLSELYFQFAVVNNFNVGRHSGMTVHEQVLQHGANFSGFGLVCNFRD